jgi:4-alpha-glucanotransferase
VLQFAFDSREESDYLPHNYDHNCVVYTGTHDNDTSRGWYEKLDVTDKAFCARYLNLKDDSEVTREMIRAALASVSDLAVVPMQDYLELGSEARVNTPSTLGDNWKWRMKEGAFTDSLVKEMAQLSQTYGRAPRQ